jgi:hypothetical protein
MKRHMLLIAVLLLLATIPPVQAQPQEYTIQRTERARDGVHYVVGFQGYTQPPEIEVQNGTLGIVSIVGESSVYRGTIAFRLNWCNSRLIVDGKVIEEQRCLWFPLAVKR